MIDNKTGGIMDEKLLIAAETALKDCLGVKKGEKLLVVTDELKYNIGAALFKKAGELGASPLLLQIPVGQYNGEEPPAEATELMKKADVVVAPTTKSLTHTNARREANKTGTRVGTMPGITKGIMERTMSADYKEIARITKELATKMEKTNEVRVTTPAGTDITMDISTVKIIASTGIVDQQGTFGNLPSGEAYCMPVEGKANGVFVVDASMAGIGKIEDKPIKITVKDGLAVKIEGGKEAITLKEQVEAIGEKARNLAELGIGTNEKATVSGDILEDEKVKGTVHLALGNNISMGGTVDVPFHVDGIMLKPTMWFDDEKVMEDGELLITL